MNVRLDVAYDGSQFSGWQRQKNSSSVQEVVEGALSRLIGETVHVSGTGRTDAGAHAFCYTMNFHCRKVEFPIAVLPSLLLSYLPPTIVPLRAEEVDEFFHARFSASAREYVYIVWRGPYLYPFFRPYVHWVPGEIDSFLMKKACLSFVGEHEFRFFCYGYGREEKRINFRRRVYYFRCVEKGAWLFFFIKGNGFLRGMIRTLVSIVLQVGMRRLSLSDIDIALHGRKDISPSLKKAVPASGLYFKRAYYSVSHQFDNQIEEGSRKED